MCLLRPKELSWILNLGQARSIAVQQSIHTNCYSDPYLLRNNTNQSTCHLQIIINQSID